MSDLEWSRLIKWLWHRGFVLHIPIAGKPYLSEKATGRYVRPF